MVFTTRSDFFFIYTWVKALIQMMKSKSQVIWFILRKRMKMLSLNCVSVTLGFSEVQRLVNLFYGVDMIRS